jgi:hypothetical protein
VEQIGFFTGLGIVIVFVAAAAAARVLAVPSGLAPAPTAETETVPAAETETVPVATDGETTTLPRRLSWRRAAEKEAVVPENQGTS